MYPELDRRLEASREGRQTTWPVQRESRWASLNTVVKRDIHPSSLYSSDSALIKQVYFSFS